MISINNNVLNLKLSNSILKSMQSLTTSLQRMMTGLKINSPADNPSGFYISSNLATQIKGLETANNNIQTAINLLGIADDSIDEINNIMGEIRDLVSKSTNEYMTPAEREANQEKINKLFAQAKQIKDSAEYNGNKLFSNSIILDKNTTYKNNPTTTTTNYSIREAQIVTTAAGMTLNRLGDRSTTNEASVENTTPTTLSNITESQGETNITEEISKQTATPMMLASTMSASNEPTATPMMVASTMSASSSPTEGTEIFTQNETKQIQIGDKSYTVTNNYTYGESNTLTWSIDDNGQIIFDGEGFTITAASGQEDNIIVNGNSNSINTGDMSDTVILNGYHGYINTGDGDDSITIENGYWNTTNPNWR